ncbi:glycosyltransferase [Cognatilysobacter lacus]|uniref:glycosyltransferase n=1 Tax=Cognatilysobacter lacus TaxID=1643323 RepID=UPI001658E9A7|nr:glycosyltransferase [Lysobacter lacus]
MLITTSFPLRADGSEAAGTFVADLALELARSVPVRVVAPGLVRARESFSHSVEVFRFAAPEKPLSTLSPMNPRDAARIVQVVRGGRRATLDAVAAGPTAHQIALWALPSGAWARHASMITGVPYSVWTLGSDIWTLGRIPLLRNYMRRVIRDAKACYSDGLQLADASARLSGREVQFLPSARQLVPTARSLRTAAPYRLLFLGRWHRNKGVDLLLDSLEHLSAADWALIEYVTICGGGPMEEQVLRRAHDLAARGWPVRCRGFLDRRAATEALEGADYLLIPSRIESIPVVFSDAMQMGCAVVAMPVGDLPRLVHAGIGEVATAVTATAFAAAIARALRRSPAESAAPMSIVAARFSIRDVVAPTLLRLGRCQLDA